MTREEAQKILAEYVKACREDDMLTLEQFVYEEVIEAMSMGAEALSVCPVYSNLEEAANKFAVFYDQGTCDGIAQDCFIAGAKWQKEQDEKEEADLFTIVALDAAQRAKEQITENALHGWLDEDNEPPYDLNVVCEEKIPFGKFKHGDKVRIIIVKEDEK